MIPSKRLEKIKAIQKRIDECEDALFAAIKNGLSSATISSGGASQSYTRYSLRDLREYIAYLRRQLATLVTGGTKRRTSPDFRFGPYIG